MSILSVASVERVRAGLTLLPSWISSFIIREKCRLPKRNLQKILQRGSATWNAVVIPRTSILGAILLTGYLGGAVATHVRVGDPLFTHTLFPVYIAVLVWGGLYLRDRQLSGFVPLRSLR